MLKVFGTLNEWELVKIVEVIGLKERKYLISTGKPRHTREKKLKWF